MANETFVDTSSTEWMASPYPGVFRKPLRFEEEGPRTTLLRMEPSAQTRNVDFHGLKLLRTANQNGAVDA